MRQQVCVDVESMEKYESDDWPPEEALAFLAWVSATIEKIPPPYRESAKFEITSESGWEGSHSPAISVHYWRDETDAEMDKREASERQRAAEREREERHQYEALRQKYEPQEGK